MTTFAQFQATKGIYGTPEEIATQIEKMGIDCDWRTDLGPMTSLLVYGDANIGIGYIEQYGDIFYVQIETSETEGTLEECEQALYIYLSPMDEE
jgi:hypothetical protein